jgi:thymidylate synthase ThyX
MLYFIEDFSEDERRTLAPYFTNLDRPVFAVVNLPEAVKGALFARYSRYPGTLRRLFLEEFADSLPEEPPAFHRSEGERAADLYQRVFVGFGDDSIAQLGGAHIACEWVSNVLTKLLQRPRLGAYLEQSTRYISYDRPLPRGGYRYYQDPELGPEYAQAMDAIFEIYSSAVPTVQAWVSQVHPFRGDQSRAMWERAVRAKTLDLLRGLLPASALSHMGIYASGQTYEQLILHLYAHPLPEARAYGEMILGELRTVIPSFVARINRSDRGGAWRTYLRERQRSASRVTRQMGLDCARPSGPDVRLLEVRGTEQDLLAALLFEELLVSEQEAREASAALSEQERRSLLLELCGNRENRRYRPGRGLESLGYRFEIVSDYGAFRDLQRHRMCTVQWQSLSPHLGADLPAEIESAGVAEQYTRALAISEAEFGRLVDDGLEASAPYALCLAYRIRYVIDLNAREAMHLIELRSGQQGHANYRVIAHEMHQLLAKHHPTVAAAMCHVDRERGPRLERIVAEAPLRTADHDDTVRVRAAAEPSGGLESERLFPMEAVDPACSS